MKMRVNKRRLRAIGLTEHDPSLTLRNPDLVFKAFLESLKEGDYQSAIEVLVGGLRYLKKTDLARRYSIPRRTIYNLLGKRSVPNLDLVAKVCRAINQESSLRQRKRAKDEDSAAGKWGPLDRLVNKQVKAGQFTGYSSAHEAKKRFQTISARHGAP